MIQTGFETRVKVQQIVENQLPEFILDESPKAAEFLKQYYISQEYQGGPVDVAENLDQYLKLDNLTPEIIVGSTSITDSINSDSAVISVVSTKGFPEKYGLFKIDDEIITYTGITTNTFTGCIRGFSGITTYHTISDPQELEFSTSRAASHSVGSTIQNLSSLFLKEFYKKLKYSLTPGLEDVDFVSDLNIGNFIKEARSFYQAKGTGESFRILFNVLYGITPSVINLEDFLIKPSAADYVRREIVVAEAISGNPTKLVGQSIRKSSDPNTYASISSVEAITRKGKPYYQISLFIGYNESTDIKGTFTIQGKSIVIENVPIGSSTITVDSTIGFPQKGNIICGDNTITYSSKSINQFFGCSGIVNPISATDSIRTDEIVYGYEDGNLSKEVKLRLTGVLSSFVTLSETFTTDEGEKIYVKNLGEIIKNPTIDKSHKEIFANSWIYNTSSRYEVDSISGSSFQLLSTIDKSSLKVGDSVDVLIRDSETLVSTNAYINNINTSTNQINLGGLSGFVYDINLKYDIRRKLFKASSSGTKLQFGNDTLISDVQNVYNENNEYMYVASNSLPSYTITKNLFEISIPEASGAAIQGFNTETQKYSIISFASNVPFITGDQINYTAESTVIPGLDEGLYFVEVIAPNQIKLYSSKSFVGSQNYVQFDTLGAGTGSQYFILSNQKNRYISPKKLLKKFPINPNIKNGTGELTQPGSTGMLINGVEIINYKSNDRIYYGPLESVNVLNGGYGYDVINLPQLIISSNTGENASIQPVIRGSIENIFVDPQDFDLNSVVSIALTGGNGKGASFEPIVTKRTREIIFDGRQIDNSGGVDINNETLTFTSSHNLNNGDVLIYDSNGNAEIGIATNSSNSYTGTTLLTGSSYYCKVINNSTIKLYQNSLDFNSGINTVGFTTVNTGGIHKFKTEYNKNTLKEIKIINPGSGYENRKLIVNPIGISSANYTINFTNHGFNDGDLVTYDYKTAGISGLSTSNQYYVLKLNKDSFRLCNAGYAGTISTYYNRQDYVKFESTGSGYQYFAYPKISLVVNYTAIGVGTGVQTIGIITATPIIRGEIIDAYLYEQGNDYGSTILNLHRKPNIIIKNGKNAQLNPIVVDGYIQDVFVQYGGSEYYSIPDLIVNGGGTGATLRPVIVDGKIKNVIIINPGAGYSQSTTSISVISSGKNSIFDVNVRSLTVNTNFKYGNEVVIESQDELQYTISGYDPFVRTYFNDTNTNTHSPLIGWAYDGNPIYGPYGYSDAKNEFSDTKLLNSGYELNTSNITNRPSGFIPGFFVEDYEYVNSGDLDESNGRYCKTPEFANGTYAYFASIDNSSVGISSFPYFIGNTYRSNYIDDNLNIDQSFDFNNSNLIRNTLPYKINDKYAGNDFIIESNELINQLSIVESVSKSSINKFDIINGGVNYKVNDLVQFDSTGTNGGGLNAIVSNLTGNEIVSIDTQIDLYENCIFTWQNGNNIKVTISPYHNLSNGDNVVISGVTSSLSQINKFKSIGITSYYTTISQDIPSNSVIGIVTDIYVGQISDNISIGSSISIESEIVSLLNVFPYEKIIRVKRNIGAAHSASTNLGFVPNSFIINEKTDYFESKVNDKIFFKPSESVGLGKSVGVSTTTVFALGISTVGVATYTRSVPTQSIYIQNHPFTNNQQVIFRKPNSSYSSLSISTSFSGPSFNLPESGNSQVVYVTTKSRDTIGIKTTLSSSEVFFVSVGATSNSYEYSIESNFNQIIAKIEKINSIVSVSTSRYLGLSNGDIINLNIRPSLSVGIGTSTSVYVKRDTTTQNILINPLGFSSIGINTVTSTITINSHKLNTGDKVVYSANLIASGLSTGSYYVYKIDDNNIKLSKTYIDCTQTPPTTVSIGSSGGNIQNITPINPELRSIRNNNLVFNLSDSSLSGYSFKLFYDKDFNNEFVSTGSTNIFTLTDTGTIGISTDASLTINYSEELPQILFYTLEKSGYISTSDKDVSNFSQITFVDSNYNANYSVSGVGSTTFAISLKQNPEKLSYTQSDCDRLEYSTTSLTAKGGIHKIKTLSGGNNYKKLPTFVEVTSSEGTGAYITAKSDEIGKIKEVRILNQGFEYASDRTLRPTAYISPLITIESSYNISSVDVIDGGNGYNYTPNLITIDSTTRNVINTGLLEAVLSGTSIGSVNIIQAPTGISANNVEIISTNNSNGTAINTVETSGVGIITCYLTTPVLGFTNPPFSAGDKVYIEGIQNYSSGSGYNSENYGYNFFTVTNFQNTNPAKLEYSIVGLTTNAGIAKTSQDSLASVIAYTDYPQFNITKSFSDFNIGEKISSNITNKFVTRDLIITSYNKSTIKVFGSYELSVGEVIKGNQSGAVAKINKIQSNNGRFDIEYSLKKTIGWNNSIGNLDEDYQVVADNDYYQNLSYTVKSPIEYEKLSTPVNRLLHTSGLKNFADTGITNATNSGIRTSIDGSIQILNFIDNNRVDTINYFDSAIDIDSSETNSKFIKLKNKKLSSYIQCKSNRVLSIDDISSKFSSILLTDTDQNNLINIESNDRYNRYFVHITDLEKSQYQVDEIIILNNQNELYTLNKGYVTNLGIGTYPQSQNRIAEVVGYTDEYNNKFLRFDPVDPYNKDYDIKILTNKFVTDLSGIGTYNLGLIDLISSNKIILSGITTSIVSVSSNTYNSLHCNIHLRNSTTNQSNYIEVYLNHDGTDTYISEYYFDSDGRSGNASFDLEGSFSSSLSSGILSLNYSNDTSDTINIRSRIVGFGTTSLGANTYRYKSYGQDDGAERTAIYQSDYSKKSGISTIVTLSKNDFSTIKSIVKVSIGKTSALHQVILLNDKTNVYTKQYPFLSIGSTSGIGSFGGEYSGSNLVLKFYPDSSITGVVDLSSYTEAFYSDIDYVNIPEILTYGTILESLNTFEFNGINGSRGKALDFDLYHNGDPIFKKIFNPTNSSILDPVTGIFTIKNHFFNSGEELMYKPKSTFIGIGQTALGIGSTANFVGIVTNTLPEKVYPIKITNDTFRLSTRPDYASAGIYVTFTSYGLGNAHELIMTKKNEKSIITIDNVAQYPISYTTINYNLNGNGGQIGASSSIFSLSGITSIRPSDILRIDDEYMKVVNIGIGTTSVGPITQAGSITLVQVDRGYVGSSATSHNDLTSIKVYRGAYNIEGNKIYFSDPPTGNLRNSKNNSNLNYQRSSFNGRVFLRKNYTNNKIYDDISTKFTGIGQTYTLTVNGINTVGLGSTGGNGILFINSIFQTPSTQNNVGNNFSIIENTTAGISSVVFSGISSNSIIITSVDDVNQNQLPRGGLIVSLGSTGGLGYAPLVGASVTAILNGSGSIIGFGTTNNFGSGYYGTVSIGVTDPSHTGVAATITATVGVGGSLSLNIVGGGSGYTNPTIKIPSPSYENLPLTGVSRIGVGSTTTTGTGLLVNIEVGASSTTGIGSTLFEVSSFKIKRSGYGYNIGDIITPVGLVTAKGIPSPVSQFQLTVLDTFTDSFAAWQFGELDYIDSVANLQDGIRTRFPLYYNSSLLSFEIDLNDPDSSQIDLNSVILIFINGVLQEPNISYIFEGGSSFTFTNPPKIEDNIAIFFYRGTRNVDSSLVNVYETIKPGDIVQLQKNNSIPSTINQNSRTIFNLSSSDKIETNNYSGQGIDNSINHYRPLGWTKQKVDQKINGELVYKTRDSIESEVYPTAKIIGDLSSNSTDTEIFVDNSQFFNYEENESATIINGVDALIVTGQDPVSAAITATVSAAGTISALTINSSGSGYVGSTVTVKISAPLTVGISTILPMGIGIGVGKTATATVSVVNGSLSTPIVITNPGLGYSIGKEPQVIAPTPDPIYEKITTITGVEGFSGIITGISTTAGTSGNPLAIVFNLNVKSPNTFPSGLSTGYPIFIYDTIVGRGVTSIDSSNTAVVGVGTTFLDNIYKIHSFTSIGSTNALITCNVRSTTSVIGIATTGTNIVGKFSWGKMSGFTRSSYPISIAVTGSTVDVGLTTFATIQRRGYGLRDTGALKKDLG
jgi:hypothetical protein